VDVLVGVVVVLADEEIPVDDRLAGVRPHRQDLAIDLAERRFWIMRLDIVIAGRGKNDSAAQDQRYKNRRRRSIRRPRPEPNHRLILPERRQAFDFPPRFHIISPFMFRSYPEEGMELREKSHAKFLRVIVPAIAAAIVLGVAVRSASAAVFDKPVNVSRNLTRIDTLAAIAVDSNNKVHIAWNGFYPKAGAPTASRRTSFIRPTHRARSAPPSRSAFRPAGIRGRGDRRRRQRPCPYRLPEEHEPAECLGRGRPLLCDQCDGHFKRPALLIDGGYSYSDADAVSAPHDPIVLCDRLGRVHVTCLAFSIGGRYEPVVYMTNGSGAWTKPTLPSREISSTSTPRPWTATVTSTSRIT